MTDKVWKKAAAVILCVLLSACGAESTNTNSGSQTNNNSGSGNTGGNTGGNTQANSAPVITGTPSSSASSGSYYIFAPTATDADNDTLTFSVSNLPAWASFDPNTGTISGTPGSADAGTYSNIVITVSDGNLTDSLAAYSINVASASVGKSLNVSWASPSTYEDGTSLPASQIGGYRIYTGTSTGNLTLVADINDQATNSFSLTNLQSGLIYIAITVYDINGAESSFSNVASTSI